jgi:proteasome accessory factor C
VNVDRLRRLLLIIPLARRYGDEGIPVEEAVTALRLHSEDELLEDVELLTMVGDPGGSPDDFIDVFVEQRRLRVVLPQGFTDPPRFNAVEAAALIAALGPLRGCGVEAVESLVEKLRSAMPPLPDQQLEATLLARAAAIEAAKPPPFRDQLLDAIDKQLEVEIDYYARGTGEAAPRRVEPRAILLHGGRWYLAAWNPEKQGEHLYRLDRMSAVRVGTRRFGEHKGPPLERYDLDHLYIPSGDEQDVEIRFSNRVAATVLQDWGETAQQNPDGSVTVRAHLAGPNYLVSWALGYGGDAEIVAPPSLRKRFTERVEELRAVYGRRP